MTDKSVIHVIAGPTASGKSALALSKAHDLNGVIINADSMQIYNALSILTAQPSAKEKQKNPHVLYGALHPNDKCSAGLWRDMAINAITDTLSQGKTPIIVGGSGLYINALIDGFSPIPDVPDEVRTRITVLHEQLGNEQFYDVVKKRDPVMAARFHPHHSARLIRALEVLETTGRSLSEFQDMPKEQPPADWRFDMTLVMPDKKTLDERCDARLEWMIDNGAVDEVQEFIRHSDVAENALIRKALGFEPFKQWLNNTLSKKDAIDRAKIDTRQYAKRQLTWFRQQIGDADNRTITRLE